MASQTEVGGQGDSIMTKAGILLKNFIFEQVRQRCGNAVSDLIKEQLQLQGACDPHLQDIAMGLRQIGDELDGRPDVQSLKEKIINLTKDGFVRIALEVFSDGIFNWGRVVMLFLLASAVVMKAIADNSFDTIKDIVHWALEFIKTYVLDWIRRQGGWEACLSYVKKPTWQKVLVLAGVALFAVFVIRKLRGSATCVDK